MPGVNLDDPDCPGCGLPAEIVDRWTWPSTEGPVVHIETLCVMGCRFHTPIN